MGVLDSPEARSTIAGRARQNNAKGPWPLGLCKRHKKVIDAMLDPGGTIAENEGTLSEACELAGRYYIVLGRKPPYF